MAVGLAPSNRGRVSEADLLEEIDALDAVLAGVP